MKVILAEKPSVARDIAAVIGANQKRDGYFEGGGYRVTYAFGHLVSQAEPETMNSDWGKPWRLNQLPMIPETWKYRVEPKTRNQFTTIKNLFLAKDTDSIICATDAGREGEHIFRLIYKMTGSKKPVERLWISSLTADAISSGMKKLKPSSEFDSLAAAAMARSQADWIVGLNFTRAYTIINKQLCTIGRVQTPTLALMVERQKAIESFNADEFFEVISTFEPGFKAKYITPGEKPKTRLKDKDSAKKILDAVKPLSEGVVSSVSTVEKRMNPPGLYDLLTLQKDANKRFGYTAQKTLDIAQSLYETHKILSYPRTESRYLSTDIVPELPGVLSAVLKAPTTSAVAVEALKEQSIEAGKIEVGLLKSKLGKSYVNNSKLTDHHAIIPTNKTAPGNLSPEQKNIYQLVSTRFMSVFLPPEIRDETTAILKLGEHSFRAQGVVIKDKGWTIIDPGAATTGSGKKKGGKKDEQQQLPPLSEDQSVPKQKVEIKNGKTSPPKPYDDASLLTAMKNAGKELDDEDLAAYMKQKGLGTPATRAAIIERLLRTGYITRQKKTLIPTEKGMALIDQVQDQLKNISLTANWEQMLADMQDEKLTKTSFDKDIATFVEEILPAVLSSTNPLKRFGNGSTRGGNGGSAGKDGNGNSFQSNRKEIGPCPKCKEGVVRETPKGAGCSQWQEGCNFSVWREVYGKKLTDSQINELVKKGETKEIKGFKKKSGNGTYSAKLTLNEEFKVRLKFDDSPRGDATAFGPCPRCKSESKEGTVRSTPKGAGCSRWQEGCNFSIWREVYGKELTDEEIKALVLKKETGLIKGFKKKSGNGTYDACLVVNEEFKVRLRFENDFSPPQNGDAKAPPVQPGSAASSPQATQAH